MKKRWSLLPLLLGLNASLSAFSPPPQGNIMKSTSIRTNPFDFACASASTTVSPDGTRTTKSEGFTPQPGHTYVAMTLVQYLYAPSFSNQSVQSFQTESASYTAGMTTSFKKEGAVL